MKTKAIKRVSVATGKVTFKGDKMRAKAVKSAAATKTTKAPNYTPEQVATMRSMYIGKESEPGITEAIAKALGKSARSVVAKLSREKNDKGESLYVAKTYSTKAGEKPVKKDELADQVGALAQLTESETESLTKVNKTALKKIIALMVKPVSATEAQADGVAGD